MSFWEMALFVALGFRVGCGNLSPRAVSFAPWYVGMLLPMSRMTVNSLCFAVGRFADEFSFACV